MADEHTDLTRAVAAVWAALTTGQHSAAKTAARLAFPTVLERLIGRDISDAEIVAIVRATPTLARPVAGVVEAVHADGSVTATVRGVRPGDPVPPCACGTVEAWHNPGCLLYPEGGYPADQLWRGPPAVGTKAFQQAIDPVCSLCKSRHPLPAVSRPGGGCVVCGQCMCECDELDQLAAEEQT